MARKKTDYSPLGTKSRIDNMSKTADKLAKCWLSLAARAHIVKLIYDYNNGSHVLGFTVPARLALYDACLRKIMDRTEDPRFQNNFYSGVRKTAEKLGCPLKDTVSEEEIYNAVEAPPFGRMELYIPGRQYVFKKSGTGWNRDDLEWILGPDASDLFKTFNAIRRGNHGSYWKDKLAEVRSSGVREGSERYNDDTLLLYYNYRQYCYLKSLKEAKDVAALVGNTHFIPMCCDESGALAKLQDVVGYFNGLMHERNIPTVTCWEETFNRQQTVLISR